MQYMIDFLVNTVKALGPGTEPVMFQREKGLYVISGNAVGHMFPAIDTSEPRTAREMDALLGSKEMPGKEEEEKRRIIDRCIGGISLGELVEVGEKLQRTDDGKVRIVGEMLHMTKELEKLATEARKEKKSPLVYAPEHFMDCMIITPYILASFPRQGGLRDHLEIGAWTEDTQIAYHCGNILDFARFSIALRSQDSPFGVYVTMNAQQVKAERPSELRHKCEEKSEELKRQCVVLERRLGSISQKIAQLNELHNAINKGYIQALQ
ncbi:hypothetical protein HZB90_03860 [archaeon]|nr:hypothetical protein [archaeon]